MLSGLLIFLFYTALFLFILYRLSLKPSFILSYKEAAIAFLVKIAAGCLYGYFFLHYYGGDDTWLYHNEGLKEFALLKSDPLHFFVNDLTVNGYKGNQLLTVFDSSGSFVKDLELNLLFKLLALFDLLGGGRYYVNVIFYNALVFWGCYFLFAVFSKKYKEKRQLWLLFIFYFPPLLFWISGIRKDGLCFSVLCGLIYQLYYLFEVKYSLKHFIYAIALFTLLFLFRNYVAVSFLPVVAGYAISKKYKKNGALIFVVVLVSFGMLFFLTALLPQSFNLPLKMAERQQAFLELSGKSYIKTDTLNQHVSSYVKILPQALNHVFLRPYFSEAKGVLYIFALIENLVFFFITLRIIVKPAYNFKQKINDPFLLSLTVFAFINYVIIGYTVPFLGALIRYKASYEIFFILALLQLQTVSFKSIKFLKPKPALLNKNPD